MGSHLRAIVYVVAMTAAVAPASLAIVLAWLAPREVRYRIAVAWTRLAIASARRLCGLSWRVEGAENLPDGPAIVYCKHQSTWETFWLPAFLPRRLTFVYKRELHWLPFFGWGLAALGMIHIDRSRGQDAFEQVVRQGANRLARGWWIVIFPEGTRTAPGSTRRYKTGGARLAARTGAALLPIAVNSGEFWPRGPLIRSPGEIVVSIGPPIDPAGQSADQLHARAEAWIETEMRRLAPHRYPQAYAPESSAPASAAAHTLEAER